MSGDNCRICAWFVPNENDNQGQCHRYPPVATARLNERVRIDSVDTLIVHEDVKADYPIIRDPDNINSWCGEFKKVSV